MQKPTFTRQGVQAQKAPIKPAAPMTRPAGTAGTVPQKRPNEAPLTVPLKKPNSAGPMVLTVLSKSETDEIGIDTLVGDYVEIGMNHGKKYFKRRTAEGAAEEGDVFLYYWDLRTGADFAGWWFGDQVGGAQVWSRCEKSDTLPPKSGWRIPWDGPVQTDLVIEPKAAKSAPITAKSEAKEETKEDLAEAAAQAEADERVQRCTDRVVIAEIEVTQSLESAAGMLEGEVTEDALKVVDEMLQAQMSGITDAQKSLAAEIIAARKSAPKSVTSLNNLSPRLRTIQASLAQEIKHAKSLLAKKKEEAEEAKKRAKVQEIQMQAEQRDATALEEALPEALEVVNAAEDMIDMVSTAASPLALENAEEMNDTMLAAIKETEVAVSKAQEALKKARVKIAQKITAAKHYAPEARKVALTEYSALQEKLNDAHKKLTPYVRIRKDQEEKLQAKKVMTDVAGKLGSVEVEVEKVINMIGGAQPSEEDIKSAESVLTPVMDSLASAMKFVDLRLQNAHGALKEDLTSMAERGKESKTRLDGFREQLQRHTEQLQVQKVFQLSLEKTQLAEDALLQTTDAETPFLKGDKVAASKAAEAIAACKEAAKAADSKVYQARNFLKLKLADVKKFPESSQANATDELTQLQNRVDAVAQKISAFKRETSLRETTMMLEEVTARVTEAEAEIQKTSDFGKLLETEKIEEVGIAKFRETTEHTLEAAKVAATACAEAKRVVMQKQKDGQAKDSPMYAAEVSKLQTRLTTAQETMSKMRKVALQAEKLYKSRMMLQEKEELVKQVEDEVERVEILTTPLGDERPSDNSIKEMVNAVNAVDEKLQAASKAMETAAQNAQGQLKSQLVKLLSRAKKSQEKIDEMKETTKEQRERVACETILQEARAKLSKMDETFQKISEAEAPYLKGMEVLPVEEATKAVAASETAMGAVQQAINEARSFLKSKSLELRGFAEAISASALEELTGLNKRHEDATTKLLQFKKETEARKHIAMQQEALAKVSDVEEAVQKTVLAAAPLTSKDVEELSSDAVGDVCDKLKEVEAEAQDKLDDARAFISERLRDKKGPMELADVQKLQSRLNSAQVDFAKAKATASLHEQKIVAKMLMKEVSEKVDEFEAALGKATEVAAPLVVDNGKTFVVTYMTKGIVEALSEHISKNNLTRDGLFAKVGPDASADTVKDEEFISFLEKVPEMCSRPELAFSPEQRKAIADQVSSAKDGTVTKADFLDMFRDRYICTHEVSITDGFDISSATGKTIDKLQVDDVVEAVNEPKSNETLGIIRVEVKRTKDGVSGWVTLQGNQGTTYMNTYTRYSAFMKELEALLGTAHSSAKETIELMSFKSGQMRNCTIGPLADAKAELAKLRPKVSQMQTKLDQLKKKIDEGKRDHSKREEFERRKQEDKKEKKAASLILNVVTDKVQKAEVELKELEEAGKQFTSATESELASVEAPITVQKAVKAAADKLSATVTDVQEFLKNNDVKLTKASRGPWVEAKQSMAKSKLKMDGIAKRVKIVTDSVQNAFSSIEASVMVQVSSSLRSAIQQRNISIENLFAELAGKGADSIPEDAFCKNLDKLKLKLAPEQKALLFLKKNAGGIGRRSFFQMLERYYKCVKEVAITNEFDIRTTGTMRKIKLGEMMEVLEGPQNDEGLELTRVQVRALIDGKTGWVTVKGNKGTPFLHEAGKPCYFATEEVVLQDGLPSESAKDIRTLKPSEVMEVIEGPQKEIVGNAMRARGKATSDGLMGWFTVKSRQGEDLVTPGASRYTCCQSIALTNDVSIKDCKVLRKLDKGEILTVIEGPIEDEQTANVVRIKAQAMKDGAEGWVTTKGNAGSVYARESGRTVVISRSMPLEPKFQSESGTPLRTLAENETVEVIEGPKEEKSEPAMRLHVSLVADGKTGWVTMKKQNLKPWSPNYRCVGATALSDALEVGKGKELRSLEAGETIELLEGPKEEAAAGVMRMRGRADKDGLVGWVTISGKDGVLLESIPSE